jgi:exportin-2 (importin alpha re-exporter)
VILVHTRGAGNIPALTRLLQAFISKTGPSIGTNAETMMALLGVFQKVVISKSNDHHAFYLLDSIVEFVPKYVAGSEA